jgi:hypothetical protein
VRDGDDLETVDPAEIAAIAGIDGRPFARARAAITGVASAGCTLAPTSSQRRGNLPEASGGSGVEWDRIKVGLGLLKMRLAGRPLLVAVEGWHVVLDHKHRRLGVRASSSALGFL